MTITITIFKSVNHGLSHACTTPYDFKIIHEQILLFEQLLLSIKKNYGFNPRHKHICSICWTFEAESNKKHGVWDPTPELTLTSPHLMTYVLSRVDSNAFTMGNPLPESTLTLCQSRLYPTVRDFGFGLCPLLGLCSVSVSMPKFTSPLQTNTAHPHSP